MKNLLSFFLTIAGVLAITFVTMVITAFLVGGLFSVFSAFLNFSSGQPSWAQTSHDTVRLLDWILNIPLFIGCTVGGCAGMYLSRFLPFKNPWPIFLTVHVPALVLYGSVGVLFKDLAVFGLPLGGLIGHVLRLRSPER